MHTGIRTDLNELQAHWPKLDLGSGSLVNMPEDVERTIREYVERPENRDGRGIRSRIVAEVRKTMRHLKSAAKRATRVGAPEARMAKKLLKALHHTRDFEALSKRARAYAGTLQRIGKQKARRTAVCEAKSISLGEVDTFGELRLERVVSVADLQAIGRQLNLCVAHNNRIGRDYHRLLRGNEAEFWQLRAQAPLALIEVDLGGEDGLRWIVQFEMARGSDVRLTKPVLLRLARVLNARGDEVAEFACVGAFWALRQPLPPTATIEIGEARYRVWRFAEEVIIQGTAEDRHGRCIRWSRFVLGSAWPWQVSMEEEDIEEMPLLEFAARVDAVSRAGGTSYWSSRCHDERALDDCQLQALMLASPELYHLLANSI